MIFWYVEKKPDYETKYIDHNGVEWHRILTLYEQDDTGQAIESSLHLVQKDDNTMAGLLKKDEDGYLNIAECHDGFVFDKYRINGTQWVMNHT